MRVLIACEFSGIVREAFRAQGHDAWSCDLLASEIPGNHFQCKIENLLKAGLGFGWEDWDLMIAHPPCTYLANSGNKHLYLQPDRFERMHEAAAFFRYLMEIPIPRIAVENPIMRHAIRRVGRKPDQVVQPWMFGHSETKATCFWLKNLSPLQPTNVVEGRRPRVHYASPSPERWKERSRTYQGIAEAMAAQWGNLIGPNGGSKRTTAST